MAREDRPYVLWVKTLQCLMAEHGGCSSVVEAHHAGPRGLSQKAHDHTCVPLCSLHHHDRHAATGVWKTYRKADFRAWADRAIRKTQAEAIEEGKHV